MAYIQSLQGNNAEFALSRPHSTILASCKPGPKPGRKQAESMSKASCELAENGFFYIPFV